MEKVFEGVGGVEMLNPLKAAVRPTAEAISGLLGDSGTLTLVAGIVALYLALKFLVDLLRVVFTSRAERLLHRTLFRSALWAIAAGIAMTVMVQSSSITTSVMVPLVGAGVVTLEQVFPFTIGANIGTTCTAMLAALATANPAAIAVAFSHLLFNLSGTVLIYPLRPIRAVPLSLARSVGNLASHRRWLAVVYIALLFYGVPLFFLLLSGGALAR